MSEEPLRCPVCNTGIILKCYKFDCDDLVCTWSRCKTMWRKVEKK